MSAASPGNRREKAHVNLKTPRIWLAVGVVAAASAALAPSTSATICPSGISPTSTNDPLLDYCVTSAQGSNIYRTFTLGYNPAMYFRMDDAIGAQTMAGYGALPDGEYKNGQDSGPIGIADDNNTAREFQGENGYGYINGVEAPNFNGGSPYGDYTMLAWIFMPTPQPGAIMQFGRAGGLYVNGTNQVVFRNGDEATAPSATTISASTWYLVAGVKQGTALRLYVKQSPTTPTYFTPAPSATGSSSYRPEGQPTFYVGYSDSGGAPWFKGSIDEVAYFKDDLTTDQLAMLFYADPPPDPSAMNIREFPTPPGAGEPAVAAPVTALGKARARVRALNQLLRGVNRQIRQLIREVAPRKELVAARKAAKQISRQLAKARKRAKALAREQGRP